MSPTGRASRLAPFAVGSAAFISVLLTMYLGRGATFTGDEMTWIIASPGMDLGTAMTSHGGHLQLIPRVVYRSMIEVFGLDYAPFRLLTSVTVAGTGILIYRYLSERVLPAVAAVPAILLMFLGSDPLHLLRGNGFTIVFAMACGVAALMMLERDRRGSDIGAAVFLVAGLATYSVTLPFVVGAAVLLILGRAWTRLWVPALPVLLYGMWRLWAQFNASPGEANGVHLESLLDLPKWIFDSLAASLSALTGIGYGVTGLSEVGPDDLFGPLLAAAFILALAFRLYRGSIKPGVWVSLAVAVSLWSIQCLATDPSSPEYRSPDDIRYMYPGAVVVVLLSAELVAGYRWRKSLFVLLALVGAFGLASNISQAKRYGDTYRAEATDTITRITAASIFFDELNGSKVDEPTEPVQTSDTASLVAVMAGRPFGGIGLDDSEIASLGEGGRELLDQRLAGFSGISLKAASGSATTGCRRVGREAVVKLPSGRSIIEAGPRPVELKLGRFSDEETVELGTVPAGKSREITMPSSIVHQPTWRLAGDQRGWRVCSPSTSG